jgi:hypothetical protein
MRARLLSHARESVRAPFFTSHTMMDEKQPVRIIFALDGAQARVIGSPECLAPTRVKIIALGDIGAARWRHFTQLDQGEIDIAGADPGGLIIRIGTR